MALVWYVCRYVVELGEKDRDLEEMRERLVEAQIRGKL